jgi:phosphate-selective porin OprO/OprP
MKTWLGAAVITALMASAAAAQETTNEAAQRAKIAALTTQIAALQAQMQQLGTATTAGTTATASTAAPTTAELAKALEALDQKIRILERKLELDAEAAAAKAQTTAILGATADGFTIKSPDNSFQLRLRGLVHSDGRFYSKETTGSPTDTFVMRRVRPILEATMFSFVDARIMPDFGGGTTVLQDAYIVARLFPQFRVRAGKFKPPVGLERLASASDILFVERALPTGLVPNRDLGVQFEGDLLKTRLLYQVGVFNGVLDGGSGDLDDRPGKDYAGRVFVTPFKGRGLDHLEGLGFGVAGSVGEITGVLATPGLTAYRTAGQQTFFRYRTGTTLDATTIASGDRRRISPQATYYSGRLGVLAEYVISSQDVARGTQTATLDATSWQVGGSWVLTGEANTGRIVRPKNSFDAAKGTWGAVELTARVNGLTPDKDAFPIFADPVASAYRARGWAAGVNWYLNRALKFTVDFEETRFKGGAAAGANRATERDVFTRFQLYF